MTRTPAATPIADSVVRYVAAVRAELADLPDDERTELTEGLEAHVTDVAAESAEPLEHRLGTPAEFASELRTAAGLPAVGDVDPARRGLVNRLADSGAAQRVEGAYARLVRHPTARAVQQFLPELRPGWWVLRGYLVVLLLGMATTDWNRRTFPVPTVVNEQGFGVIALAIAIPASIAWSRHARAVSTLRAATVVANIAVVLFALHAFDNGFIPRYASTYYLPVGASPHYPGLDGVTNIYPYDVQGHPLDNVLLYDQHGNPIDELVDSTASGLPILRTFPHTLDGQPVTNLFPYLQSVIDPATGQEIGREQRPKVMPPQLAPTPSPAATPSASPKPTARPTTTTRPAAKPSASR
ncbi:MAG: hypothetical protein ABR520_02760 [Mycobacteriales bacterium]|nr:hypothetical protein [Frankia sp.]